VEIVDLLAKMDDRLARQDEILAQQSQILARIDIHLSQIDQRIARQDKMLELQTEALRLIDNHVTQAVTLTDMARQAATAAQQTTVVALQRYAETRLDVDKFIATAERVLAAWARQQP
jgi:hypothetical protein